MNFIQQSIQRTREKLHELKRLKAVVARRVKQEQEEKNALMETLLDTVCAETDLRCENPEDREMILLHVSQVLTDAKRRKAEEDQHQWNPDEWPK
jgi:phage gp46-like protein